jgi:hypothetical protein
VLLRIVRPVDGYLAVLPTAALASIPGLKPALAFYVSPVVDAMLVFKEALVGAAVPLHVALTVTTMVLFGLVCIALTLRLFSNERVLLRR